MIKRFVIAAVILAVFLGGVGYFNLVFKPKMIAEFIGKMTPPPATVTAEKAITERWTDRVHSIGTLFAIEGVDVAPQLAGQVTDYFFDSGDDVQKGAKLVQLDTLVEEADLANNKATLQQANLDLRPPIEAREAGGGLASHSRCHHRQTRLVAGCRSKDGGDHRGEDHHRAVRRAARAASCREGAICDGRPGSRLAAGARSDLGRLPGA